MSYAVSNIDELHLPEKYLITVIAKCTYYNYTQICAINIPKDN